MMEDGEDRHRDGEDGEDGEDGGDSNLRSPQKNPTLTLPLLR
ncbi:hypothetical protein [Laspinema olomoucense]|nr:MULTISPECIES: hypothetical protein [unclassified Laspinema]